MDRLGGMEALRRLGQSALDAVYPPRCGLCGLIGPGGVCRACVSVMREHGPVALPAPCDGCHGVFLYDGRAAQAVRRLKYSRVTSLAGWMSERVAECSERMEHFGCGIVAPVPVSRSRQFERGFNQADLLSDALRRMLPVEGILERVRHTRPQVGLLREERLSNLMGSIRAKRRCDGEKVLLIDDVTTSGGTALACAKALKDAGAERVCLLAFAAEPMKDH